MNVPRLALGLMMVPPLLFCVYGALASLEPSGDSPIHTGWFIGYCLAGVGLLAASVHLLRSGLRRRPSRTPPSQSRELSGHAPE